MPLSADLGSVHTVPCGTNTGAHVPVMSQLRVSSLTHEATMLVKQAWSGNWHGTGHARTAQASLFVDASPSAAQEAPPWLFSVHVRWAVLMSGPQVLDAVHADHADQLLQLQSRGQGLMVQLADSVRLRPRRCTRHRQKHPPCMCAPVIECPPSHRAPHMVPTYQNHHR